MRNFKRKRLSEGKKYYHHDARSLQYTYIPKIGCYREFRGRLIMVSRAVEESKDSVRKVVAYQSAYMDAIMMEAAFNFKTNIYKAIRGEDG